MFFSNTKAKTNSLSLDPLPIELFEQPVKKPLDFVN